MYADISAVPPVPHVLVGEHLPISYVLLYMAVHPPQRERRKYAEHGSVYPSHHPKYSKKGRLAAPLIGYWPENLLHERLVDLTRQRDVELVDESLHLLAAIVVHVALGDIVARQLRTA